MKIFSSQYFDQLLSAAARSQRLRAHANVHHSYADQCQKLFNAIKVDSYIRSDTVAKVDKGCKMQPATRPRVH